MMYILSSWHQVKLQININARKLASQEASLQLIIAFILAYDDSPAVINIGGYVVAIGWFFC